ncbi:MAG: hypothetical protein WDW38_009107 [Sanguina aurantia]
MPSEGVPCSIRSRVLHKQQPHHNSSCRSTPSVRTHVLTPARVESSPIVPASQPATTTTTIVALPAIGDILTPVAADLVVMNANLKSVVGNRHPMLMAAAEVIFNAGGKKLRPALVFLVSRATADHMALPELNDRHRRLAEITEMIHTASLVHDDVLDDCNVRRGASTINSLYGTRIAVLAGDYLFAQSSWFLANLDNLEVIKLISQVIADFANGEISQAASLFDTDITLEQYLDKSFYKTASLIAASCRSASVFSDSPVPLKEAMYNYGKHLGLAFQIVDDILDFTQTSEQLGKPQGQDLASGNLTAPIIYALRKSPELLEIITSEFREEGSLPRALQLVNESGGIEESKLLARQQADMALACLESLSDSPSKRAMVQIVEYVLERIY